MSSSQEISNNNKKGEEEEDQGQENGLQLVPVSRGSVASKASNQTDLSLSIPAYLKPAPLSPAHFTCLKRSLENADDSGSEIKSNEGAIVTKPKSECFACNGCWCFFHDRPAAFCSHYCWLFIIISPQQRLARVRPSLWCLPRPPTRRWWSIVQKRDPWSPLRFPS